MQLHQLTESIYLLTLQTASSAAKSSESSDIEFLKIFIPMLSGFLTAFLAEPIKIFFTNQSRENNIKATIYSEIILIYEKFIIVLSMYEKSPSESDFSSMLNGKFDCYEYAKSEPSIFYKFPEAASINRIYENLNLIKRKYEDGIDPERISKSLKLSILEIETLFARSQRNKKLILRLIKHSSLKGRIEKIINKTVMPGKFN
jgi:hypothetical protein